MDANETKKLVKTYKVEGQKFNEDKELVSCYRTTDDPSKLIRKMAVNRVIKIDTGEVLYDHARDDFPMMDWWRNHTGYWKKFFKNI